MTDKSWIKLYRKMVDWEWFTNAHTLQMFIYLLLTANVEDKNYKGIIVKRGEVVSTYSKLATSTNMSIQQARTAISNLQSTREITSKGYAKFSVFTVVNYDFYQSSVTNKQHDSQQTNNAQVNKQITSNPTNKQHDAYNIKEYKNKNKEKELYINTAVACYSEDAELRNLILDFYDSRKKMKKPMTDKAVDMFLNKLRPYPVSEQKQMIENAIVNGWQSVYPVEKLKQQTQQYKPKYRQGQDSVFSSNASYDISDFTSRAIGLRPQDFAEEPGETDAMPYVEQDGADDWSWVGEKSIGMED